MYPADGGWYDRRMDQPVRPLHVRGYLLDHTFQQLEDEHGVCARPSQCFTKYGLNYDMVLARSGDPVADQCRGLIVRPLQIARLKDAGDGWKHQKVGLVEVVAWPMERFYNHGDPKAIDIDWSAPGLRVYEKLDGTMCVLYFDHLKHHWCVGTRSVCEADVPVSDSLGMLPGTTFADLFWSALHQTLPAGFGPTPRDVLGRRIDFLERLDPYLTYVFELTGPHNRVVVRYDEPRVTLLAVRDTATGHELGIDAGHVTPFVPRPATWDIHSASGLVAFVDAADPAKVEGAVVCSAAFERLKVKNKQWVLSSRAKDMVTVSRRSALEAVVLGTIDDVLPLIDGETRAQLQAMIDGYRAHCLRVDARFAQWRDEAAGSRKAFAGFVCASDEQTPPYFAMWEGKAPSMHAWAKDMAERGKLTPTNLDVMLSKIVQ